MLILVCALVVLISNVSFAATQKFRNGFEIKFSLNGKDLMRVAYITLIGAFGVVPTGYTGRCKTICA